MQSVLRQLPRGGLERQAIKAGEIDAIIDYGSANVIVFPAARRALRKGPVRALPRNREAARVVPTRNQLLAALPRAEYRLLVPALEHVMLESGDVLNEVGASILQVYFPVDCVVALLTRTDSHRAVQTGMIGHEGMVGTSLALGAGVSSVRALVLVRGTALRMAADQFKHELQRGSQLQRQLNRYAQVLSDQAGTTAACLAAHRTEQRLACWLLMIGDRARSQEIPLTQAQVATVFSVRRESVDSACGSLRARGLISYRPGDISIRDRKGLVSASCRCYRRICIAGGVEVEKAERDDLESRPVSDQAGAPGEGLLSTEDGIESFKAESQSLGDGAVTARIEPESKIVEVSLVRNPALQARQMLASLEHSNDAVFSFDPQGCILSWNTGAHRTYGYPADVARRIGLFALIPASGHGAAREMIDIVMAHRNFGPANADRLTRDGRVIRASVTVSAVHDEDGRVYALLSTERDVTEQLRSEIGGLFRRLADNILLPLRVEDADGMAEFVNSACAEFTGQSREALSGRGWLQFVHPQDRDVGLARRSAAEATGTIKEEDFRMMRADGAYRWMHSISVPYPGPDGRLTGFVSLMLDVEDRERAESALLTAERHRSELLAMLAHELRNPLAAIGNAAQFLTRSGTKDDRIAWAAGVIGRQTIGMAKLLDSLLDVARIATGRTVLQLAPVDLSVVVARALEMIGPLTSERRLQVRVTAPAPRELFVEGDVLRLTQVLVNLLDNASKYSDEGAMICLDVLRIERAAVMQVRDFGAGLTKETIPRVFDLFMQTDRTLDRTKGGLGLGLTLVRQLVELHGGSVEATSEGLGRGSTFTVRLPLLARAPAIHSPLEGADAAASGRTGRRMLVVDDNVDGALTLANALETLGHQVSVAHSGPAAIAMLSTADVEVAILDIGLPGMDGYALARVMRSRPECAGAMLIALTGYGQPSDVKNARDAGFDVHLVKPVDLDVLSELIKQPLPNA